MQNQTISDLFVDDKKSKLASKDILIHLQKKIYEKLYTKENVSKSAINELLNRTPNH